MKTMNDAPDVDVIIAVHRTDRPLKRAVESALNNSGIQVRVLLVLHRLEAENLMDYNYLKQVPEVVFLQCEDDFPSAAAPRNVGLENVSARWVATLDSDDFYKPGALEHWVKTGDSLDADAVIPRHLRENTGIVRTPPKRLLARRLHPVKDRLAYRVGHLGLTKTSVLTELGLRYEPKMSVGEDLFFSYPLWFSGKRIVADNGPAYVVGDSGNHISHGHDAEVELASVSRFLISAQFQKLTEGQRLSVAVKFLRGQIMSAISNRDANELDDQLSRKSLCECIQMIFEYVPQSISFLSKIDCEIVQSVLSPAPGTELVRLATERKASFAKPKGLLPTKAKYLFHREAPLRFAFASALVH